MHTTLNQIVGVILENQVTYLIFHIKCEGIKQIQVLVYVVVLNICNVLAGVRQSHLARLYPNSCDPLGLCNCRSPQFQQTLKWDFLKQLKRIIQATLEKKICSFMDPILRDFTKH